MGCRDCRGQEEFCKYRHALCALWTDLVEVLGCGPHLLPGFVEQLDADAEELLPRSVVGEEHGVVVVTALVSCTQAKSANEKGNLIKSRSIFPLHHSATPSDLSFEMCLLLFLCPSNPGWESSCGR